MKKILITGKNSYIGRSFIDYCNKFDKNFIFHELSVHGKEWRNHNFSQYDAVFHVAGIAHSTPNKKQKALYYKVNCDLAIEVAKHARECGVKQFLYMSSAIVYTNSKLIEGKITKNTIPKSNNFYGDSKIRAEKGLLSINDRNFKIVIIRPPLIYGKGSKGNYKLLSNWAKNIPFFPEFENKRSMLYVENLCELLRLLIINKEEGIFCPQNQHYVNTKDLVKVIAEAHGKKIIFLKHLTPLLNRLISYSTIFNKVFGDFIYDYDLSNYKQSYAKIGFKESIYLTER